MADTKVIAATLQVDTGSSNANIKEVNKNLSDVKTSLKETGSAAATTGKSVEESSGSFTKLKQGMSSLPGPLGAASSGVAGLGKAFLALLANPIVLLIAAIVAGLALLYKAFTNTFEGGEKMEQIFAGIKAAGQALLDNLGKLANVIVKLFKFDFSGAKKEFDGVVKAAGDAYIKTADLTKQLQQLTRDQAAADLGKAKRDKDLAKLREQLADESVSTKKKKEISEILLKDAEINGAKEIAIAKNVTSVKIALLEIEKDGEKKNFSEIQGLLKDQEIRETAQESETRRIRKAGTMADKQEIAERKAAEKEAADAAKAERQKLVEFTDKLTKLQQENQLLRIKDGYEKEMKLLLNKVAEEKRVNDLAFKDHKINRQQQNELNNALDSAFLFQQAELLEKHNKEITDKEVAFQKDIQALKNKIRLDGITDTRELEKVQLKITYEEQLKQAIELYKDNQQQFQIKKHLLDEEFRAAQEKIDAKNAKEDAKKKFDLAEQALKEIIDKKDNKFQAKIDAVNAEQVLFKKAFNDKALTELEYNDKVKGLAEARMKISASSSAG